jgi:transcriptional regulator with XRE-family HTH domain
VYGPPLALRLAAHLRQIRRARGLTQAQLAELTGLRFRSLQDLEGGRAKPQLEVVDQIAAQLGMDPLALLAPIDAPTRRRPGRPPRR